jgi:hypothetical protein
VWNFLLALLFVPGYAEQDNTDPWHPRLLLSPEFISGSPSHQDTNSSARLPRRNVLRSWNIRYCVPHQPHTTATTKYTLLGHDITFQSVVSEVLTPDYAPAKHRRSVCLDLIFDDPQVISPVLPFAVGDRTMGALPHVFHPRLLISFVSVLLCN